MSYIPKHLQLAFEPVADPGALVLGPGVRFTVLTSRLIRMEHSPSGRFEDRPSQPFWYRRQPVPEFQVVNKPGRIEIITDYLHLKYDSRAGGFTPDSLSIELKWAGAVWHYGDEDPGNLLGTARTLDMASGRTRLGQGLLSRSGWALVDDSKTLVFDRAGWLEERPTGSQDLYFFGYGHDYQQALQDYCRIAGPMPLLPRWALGNWWSRYWAYTQDELKGLMEEFEANQVPLAVCIIDMDWHITQTGNACSGWTGYTWNRELWPDPEGFIAWLHEKGLKTAVNVHPAEGVHPHEAAYEAMARAMEIDPATQQPVEFDIADPRFTQAYFERLHHPMEAQGIDFWWMDWQQGTMSRLPGLDPLWWLNHLHFYDLGRDGARRPFIFSRWGGLGNHRYQIGFSGDTVVTWESLAFQPYFTATASNVAYGWWSHDIGGHMGGVEDPELYARWVQYGVFSPILRLHSTKNPYQDRRPWGHGAEVLRVTRRAMQLRHALTPYLYSMSWRAHTESIPLIRPMYYLHPESAEAYVCPNQYYFGSELLAAPYIHPQDSDTRLSRQVAWLPQGDWFDLFSGRHCSDGWQALYGGLDEIPVFARAGAIVPLGPLVGWGGIENPQELTVHIFPGADNRFELYEDDGESTGFVEDKYCLTTFSETWHGDRLEFRIEPARGDTSLIPAQRRYELVFRGVRNPSRVTLEIAGTPQPCTPAYDEATETMRLGGITLPAGAGLAVTLAVEAGSLSAGRDRTVELCDRMLRAFRLESWTKAAIGARLQEIVQDPRLLAGWGVTLADAHVRALVEVIKGAGVELITNAGPKETIILWNNSQDPGVRYRLAGWSGLNFFHAEEGPLPRFEAVPLEPALRLKLMVDYLGLATTNWSR